MAKVKWRAREFNPTANMEGRSHSFYAEAVINSDLSYKDVTKMPEEMLRWHKQT